jgi:histidinol dehydrogenase
MMEFIAFPEREIFRRLCRRPQIKSEQLTADIISIFSRVEKLGYEAVREFTLRYDKVDIADPVVNLVDYTEAFSQINPELKEAIQTAYQNIRLFHEIQIQAEWSVETMEGVVCSQKSVGIERVGLYIPGGSAPLFSSVLMLAIPAMIAGCRDVVLCTPPEPSGKIHPVTAWCARLCGINEIYAAGGAQAIAMMTLGTEQCKPVFKLFGPGNQYVTAAKQYAIQFGVAADMPAGPSEVLVFADDTAVPEFIASDLLAQAEHGPDSQVVLVTLSRAIVEEVLIHLKNQLSEIPRKKIAEQALSSSRIIQMNSVQDAFELINMYAPEHLIIASETPELYKSLITTAGSVFMGNYTPESAGDYASGTNHTLPTNGWAQSYSGLNVDAFTKKITFQNISRSGLARLGPDVIEMAEAESLDAHAAAVSVRLKSLNTLL